MKKQAKTNPEIAGTQMTRKEALDAILKISAKSKKQIAQGQYCSLDELMEHIAARRKKLIAEGVE